jgi:hypothetical protein
MGKRELLLVCAFVTIGAIVYYATAPAAAPGQQGFSLSKAIEGLRREIRGNRSSAEVTTTSVIPLKPGIAEVRFELGNGSVPLTISGEDRPDVLCELQVWSNGFDETEARKYASETALKTTETSTSLAISIKYPEPGSQRATLVVRMPKTMTVRIQPSRGKLDIADVAAVELVEARGQAGIRRIGGRLTATHRGGTLTIEDVAALKLNTRGSTIVLKGVTGDAAMQVQAGELRGQSIAGAIDVESNGTRINFEDLTSTRRPIRINAIGGSVKVAGLRSEARIDGRDTRIDVTIEQPAAVAIYNEQEEPMEVTLPAGGFQLDALAIDGSLTVPPGLPEVKTTENEQRASGAIGGGGPTVTLRSSRGNITIRGKVRKTSHFMLQTSDFLL